MLKSDEVNAPLFREVHYGEAVTLDPVKLVIFAFEPNEEGKTMYHYKKYQTLAVAWWLAQPWCEKQKMTIKAETENSVTCWMMVETPHDKLSEFGVPTSGTSLKWIDWKAIRAGKIDPPPLRDPNHCPDPITLDPKEFSQGGKFSEECSTKELAYLLCLSGVSVIDEDHIKDEEWAKYGVPDKGRYGFYFWVSVDLPQSILRDREKWLADIIPKT